MKSKKSTKKLITVIVLVLAIFAFIKLFFVGFSENFEDRDFLDFGGGFRACSQDTQVASRSHSALPNTGQIPVKFPSCSADTGSENYGSNNFEDYYANWNYSPYFTPLPAKENSYAQYYSDLPMITDKWLIG